MVEHERATEADMHKRKMALNIDAVVVMHAPLFYEEVCSCLCACVCVCVGVWVCGCVGVWVCMCVYVRACVRERASERGRDGERENVCCILFEYSCSRRQACLSSTSGWCACACVRV